MTDLQVKYNNLKSKIESIKLEKGILESKIENLSDQKENLEKEIKTLANVESIEEAKKVVEIAESKLEELVGQAQEILSKAGI